MDNTLKKVFGYIGIVAVLLLVGLPLFWILMTSGLTPGK